MGLSKTDMNVLYTAKCSKLPVESDWISKTSQNVQILGFLETEMGFCKNFVFKLMKCVEFSKFAVEWDRNSKSFQNVQFFFNKKIRWVFPEKTSTFENRWR